MNTSPYKISGPERRQLKKEIASLKRSISQFWYWENFEGPCEDVEEATTCYNKLKARLKVREAILNLPA